MLPEDRIKAQEEVWFVVLDIVGDYDAYHQKGPDSPENNAQKLAVCHIKHDLEVARAFGLAAIPRTDESAQKGIYEWEPGR